MAHLSRLIVHLPCSHIARPHNSSPQRTDHIILDTKILRTASSSLITTITLPSSRMIHLLSRLTLHIHSRATANTTLANSGRLMDNFLHMVRLHRSSHTTHRFNRYIMPISRYMRPHLTMQSHRVLSVQMTNESRLSHHTSTICQPRASTMLHLWSNP